MSKNKSVATWLFVCCFMVFCMVVVGGLTRLTESGLSITEWKPVRGIIPPISDDGWQEEFEAYKQSPEFQKKNFYMSVEEFKGIFWLEFIHRLLGRMIGLIFFVPLVYFFVKKRIQGIEAAKLFGIFLLGGLQGVVGWFMVKSGLVDDPRVSQYRLALHMGLACIIFSLLLWQALNYYPKKWKKLSFRTNSVKKLSILVTGLIFLQITAGAFVAGLDAGLTYNTFPLMDGDFVPVGYDFTKSLHDIGTVQFNHRWLGFITLFSVILLWAKTRETASNLLISLVAIQIIIGIVTLTYVVPIPLASLHQAVAMLILAVSLFINWRISATKGR